MVRVDNIGDFVLWLDAAAQMRAHYRPRRFVAVVGLATAELAQRCGVFDDVVSIDIPKFTSSLFYRWQSMRKIQQINAMVAVQPTYSRVFLTGDSIIRVSGALERIGFVSDLSNMSKWQRVLSDRWYTHLVRGTSSHLMEIDRNREFLHGLGVANAESRVTRLPVMTKLPDALRIAGDYFVVFPGASWVGRMWPVTSFAQVAKALYEQHGWRLVVCGGNGESALGVELLARTNLAEAQNLCGETSLTEFVEVVRGARLLVGNDTSAVHIAASVGTPAVCILGGGHFGRFAPYSSTVAGAHPGCVYVNMPCFGCNWRCTQPRRNGTCVPCIENVQVDSVLEAVGRVLDNDQRHASAV